MLSFRGLDHLCVCSRKIFVGARNLSGILVNKAHRLNDGKSSDTNSHRGTGRYIKHKLQESTGTEDKHEETIQEHNRRNTQDTVSGTFSSRLKHTVNWFH